jgi:hypothetical protein
MKFTGNVLVFEAHDEVIETRQRFASEHVTTCAFVHVLRAPCFVRRASCAVLRAPCFVRRASCAVLRAPTLVIPSVSEESGGTGGTKHMTRAAPPAGFLAHARNDRDGSADAEGAKRFELLAATQQLSHSATQSLSNPSTPLHSHRTVKSINRCFHFVYGGYISWIPLNRVGCSRMPRAFENASKPK